MWGPLFDIRQTSHIELVRKLFLGWAQKFCFDVEDKKNCFGLLMMTQSYPFFFGVDIEIRLGAEFPGNRIKRIAIWIGSNGRAFRAGMFGSRQVPVDPLTMSTLRFHSSGNIPQTIIRWSHEILIEIFLIVHANVNPEFFRHFTAATQPHTHTHPPRTPQ